jgi:hypothetical protein
VIRLEDFSVAFGAPKAGWIRIDLSAGGRRVSEWFANSYPSLATLCGALADVVSGVPARATRLLLEPEELELAFVDGAVGSVRIELRHYRSALQRQPSELIAHAAPRRVLVLELWRALYRLQTSVPEDVFAYEWGSRFPERELEAVAAGLRISEPPASATVIRPRRIAS